MTGKGSFLKEGQLKTDRHSHEGPGRKDLGVYREGVERILPLALCLSPNPHSTCQVSSNPGCFTLLA